MDEHDLSYICTFRSGWAISAVVIDDKTRVRLTNAEQDTGMYESDFRGRWLFDLIEGRAFIPAVYHDGISAPPLVCFHDQQSDTPVYVWEPRSGRLYCAGSDEWVSSL